jgi:tRNA-splicing endonuclease subunit Sen54
MADSDEDDTRHPLSPSHPTNNHHQSSEPRTPHSIDADLSEETQDFRFLASLTATSTGSTPTAIPRRGEKDFEPNPTRSQQAALRASRQAMHDALSVERVHRVKNWVLGYLMRAAGGNGRGEKGSSRLWKCVVRVDQSRGTHFRTMGVSDVKNRMWLLPEEALYLVERGSLDVRWSVPEEIEGEHEREDATGGSDQELEEQKKEDDLDAPSLTDLPMSLQGAYASFISDNDLSLARYTVFAGLKRSGYTVIRAPTWDESPPPLNQKIEDLMEYNSTNLPRDTSSVPPKSGQSLFGWAGIQTFLARVFHFLFRISPSKASQRRPYSCPALGPLVAPGLYRSYLDIYRALTLIPFHDPISKPSCVPTSTKSTTPSTPSTSQPQKENAPTSTIPPFRVCYHVYKPSSPYRKTSPPSPDFQLAVIDARSHPAIPNLTELGILLEEMPIHDPKEDEKLKTGRPEMRLRAGTRSVVLAVVDGGVVSFLRIAETGSGREKIYEGKVTRGVGKYRRRGGISGGRGRGRGR